MKISLVTKFFFGLCLVLLTFGLVSIYGVSQMNKVRDQLNTVNLVLIPLNDLSAKLDTLQESIHRSTENILRFDNLDRQRFLLARMHHSFQANMLARLSQARTILQRVSDQRFSDRDLQFIRSVQDRLQRLRERVDGYGDTLESLIQSIIPEQEQPAIQEDIEALKRSTRWLAAEVRLLKLSLKNNIKAKVITIEKNQSAAIGVILLLTAVAIFIGILVAFLNYIALRPLKRLAVETRRISQGDFSLTVEVPSTAEFAALAQEFNRMAKSLSLREKQRLRQQEQLELANRRLKQSGIDLELLKLYSENIIRSIHNGILVADPQKVVTTINPAGEILWNLSPDNTIGKHLAELPIAPALSGLTDSWEKVLINKENLFMEGVEHTTQTKGMVLFDLYVSPLVGHDDTVQGVLLVGEDVTEKVRTKQALIQSERLATIGRMSALVAHEIRNPLSSIGLNTELLEDELDEAQLQKDDEPRKLLRSISREVERLTEVTEEYLKFARLPKPHLIDENVNDILSDLFDFLQEEIRHADVNIDTRFAPNLPAIRADEGQLKQAFINIIRNSLESMQNGGNLSVTTGTSEDHVVITITDTGSGIDNQNLDRIFDPFFSTRNGGTGLGLSLTQQIVNEHRGVIQCESQPQKGTSFIITLPVVTEHSSTD